MHSLDMTLELVRTSSGLSCFYSEHRSSSQCEWTICWGPGCSTLTCESLACSFSTLPLLRSAIGFAVAVQCILLGCRLLLLFSNSLVPLALRRSPQERQLYLDAVPTRCLRRGPWEQRAHPRAKTRNQSDDVCTPDQRHCILSATSWVADHVSVPSCTSDLLV